MTLEQDVQNAVTEWSGAPLSDRVADFVRNRLGIGNEFHVQSFLMRYQRFFRGFWPRIVTFGPQGDETHTLSLPYNGNDVVRWMEAARQAASEGAEFPTQYDRRVSFGVFKFHGLSDGLKTGPVPVHLVISDLKDGDLQKEECRDLTWGQHTGAVYYVDSYEWFDKVMENSEEFCAGRTAEAAERCTAMIGAIDFIGDDRKNQAASDFLSLILELDSHWMRAFRARVNDLFDPVLRTKLKAIIGKTSGHTFGVQSWIQSAPSLRARLYREQAFETYPKFVFDATKPDWPYRDEADRKFCDGLTDVIDSGGSVSAYLRKEMSDHDELLKPSTIRGIQKIFFSSAVMSQAIDKLREECSFIDNLAPASHPRNASECDLMGRLANACNAMAVHLRQTPSDILQDLASAYGGGDWRNLEYQISGPIQGARDYMQAVTGKLVLPYAVALAAADMGLNEITADLESAIPKSLLDHNPSMIRPLPKMPSPFSSLQARRIVRLSKAWHDAGNAFWNRIRSIDLDDGISWHPLIQGPLLSPDGMQIIPLCSKRELAEEGEAMGHCVAGYTAACTGMYASDRYSHIFSLRDSRGQRVATLELVEKPLPAEKRRILEWGQLEGKKRYGHASLFGQNDNNPASRSGQWLLDQLLSGGITPDWSSIEAARKKNRDVDAAHRITQIAGFDSLDASKREQAFRAFQPHLPERHRYWSYDEWLVRSGLDDQVRAFLRAGRDYPQIDQHPRPPLA